uniref:Coiled-coil domain-containing protein 96 n=1 Tax=Lygus hesperus TaxID=30085 RepID=A0A0A9YD44_LYGHE
MNADSDVGFSCNDNVDEQDNVTNGDDGMFLIDFEQLKIESNTLHDKIEERNEDLSRLTRKVNTTVHVLAHVKEKLSYLKSENEVVSRELQATEDEVNTMRDQLAQLKKRRDHFHRHNKQLK